MLRILRLPTILILLLSALQANSVYAAAETKAPSGKIMKWVDEQGVTHYGDTLPPQYSGKQSSINGRSLPQAEASNPASAESGKESDQARRDRTLQAVYSTEQEIDLARDRNLQMDQAMLEGLEQRKLSANARLQELKNIEANHSKRGTSLPPDFKKDFKNALLDISKIDEQIVERKQHMDTTRLRFDTDKKRFIELKTGVPAGESASPVR